MFELSLAQVEFFTSRKANPFFFFFFQFPQMCLEWYMCNRVACSCLKGWRSSMPTSEGSNKLWMISCKDGIYMYSLWTFLPNSWGGKISPLVFIFIFPSSVHLRTSSQYDRLGITDTNLNAYWISLYLSVPWFLFITMYSICKTTECYYF